LSSNIMELGAVAVLISSVAAAYVLSMWYIGTRWMMRALRDTPAKPQRLEIVIEERKKLA
jgi:hypothetical protein